MKDLAKVLIFIAVLSLFPLLYVREQIALFQISYLIDEQSRALSKISEEYRRLKFEVDQLKSPRFLEGKMRELGFNLTLPQEIRVVRIPPSFQVTAAPRLEPVPPNIAADRILNFLGRWMDIAQAKTDQ